MGVFQQKPLLHFCYKEKLGGQPNGLSAKRCRLDCDQQQRRAGVCQRDYTEAFYLMYLCIYLHTSSMSSKAKESMGATPNRKAKTLNQRCHTGPFPLTQTSVTWLVLDLSVNNNNNIESVLKHLHLVTEIRETSPHPPTVLNVAFFLDIKVCVFPVDKRETKVFQNVCDNSKMLWMQHLWQVTEKSLWDLWCPGRGARANYHGLWFQFWFVSLYLRNSWGNSIGLCGSDSGTQQGRGFGWMEDRWPQGFNKITILEFLQLPAETTHLFIVFLFLFFQLLGY